MKFCSYVPFTQETYHLNMHMYYSPGVGVTKPIFSVPLFSHFFPNDENSGYLNDIKFIFGRCHRSWASGTPEKYEYDWKYLTYTFTESWFPVTEKLTSGALVTPTPAAPLDVMDITCKHGWWCQTGYILVVPLSDRPGLEASLRSLYQYIITLSWGIAFTNTEQL